MENIWSTQQTSSWNPFFALPVQCQVDMGIWNHAELQRQVRKSRDLIQRLKIDSLLKLHTGCVNTLHWHQQGRFLLSGSDDLNLVIWDTLPKSSGPFRFKTDHRGNIFSAKFLPIERTDAVVSTSSEGLVIYSQIREANVVQTSFNCHTGSTYRVLPLADDPSSFVTCSEDGTVRLFDIRQAYEKCDKKSGCSHSLLANMGKAVSAIAVSPVNRELAVGCSDSTVSFYDRRKMTAPLNRIRCLTTKNMPRRITSLQYDPSTGMQLLVNILCENIQLLDLRVGASAQDGTSKELQAPVELFPVDPMPIKRLRLRGDWSDTGPSSRPNQRSPEAASGSNRFMTEISDLMTTWMRSQIVARDSTEPTRAPLVSTTNRSGDGGRNDSGIEDLLASAATRTREPLEELASLKPVMEYSGHRSSRTMIKEACFWDDSYIMSGSDCGRIFVWDRETGKLANVVEGDKHVVNCVQPHPFDFVMATSGIDHDIKIWRPASSEAVFDVGTAQGYMDVNNQMLAETRDTVTVPALCVVKILRAMARTSQDGDRRRQQENAPGNHDAVAAESSDSEPGE